MMKSSFLILFIAMQVSSDECSKYANNGAFGTFKLCWTISKDLTEMMISHPQATSESWIGLGRGTDMLTSTVAIGSTAGTKVVKPISQGDTSWQDSPITDSDFENIQFMSVDGETLIKFSLPEQHLSLDLVAGYGSIIANKYQIHNARHVQLQQLNIETGTTSSPTSPPTSGSEASIGGECSKYTQNKNIGNSFRLCWSLNKDSTEMMVTHPGATATSWIALGKGANMISSTVAIGSGTGYKVVKASSKTDTSWQDSPISNSEFQDIEFISKDGETLIKFTLPSRQEVVDIVAAYGPKSNADKYLYHTARRGVEQNLVTGASAAQPFPVALIFHAIFMTLGWGLLLPAGMLMARYGKEKWPPTEGGSKIGWFDYHKYIQVAGLVIVTIGVIIGLAEGSKTKKIHMAIGLTVTILGLWQPLNAKFRPHKRNEPIQTDKRRYWEYLHKGSGYLAILLGFVNIIVGLLIALQWG